MSKFFSSALAVALMAGMFASALEAQTTYGAIVGTARDASGAVLAKVIVTVTNEATGTTVSEITNELGAYSFSTLIPGRYRIRAELAGFRPLDINGVQLQVNKADATGQPANLPVDQRTPGRWFNTGAFVDPPFTRY